MAAKKDKYDKLQDKELAALLRELDAIYADLANEVGSIGATFASSVDKDKPFVLAKYPLIQKRVDAVIKKLAKRLRTSVVNGVRSAWTLANQKNNELCRLVFGAMLGQLTKEQERRYYTSNDNALNAFLQRKVKGLNLSDRVWNYAEMCKQQIEATLELGIKTGEGAAEMATDLKTYLKYPDKLFRRVRGADGKLHLSKAASEFHPGQGVYRSSYKNAYRLARTETNIAYRSADYLRRTQLDFVVGIEIHLSNNHTCLGLDGKPHPFHDICDDLKGKYPKWFDFKGWHPACRCFTTTILKTDEEIERDMDGIDRGSVNEVKKMPPQWDKWLEKNRERVDLAAALGRLPYFLNDNPWAWQEGVEMPKSQNAIKPALLKAKERHMARTPEQVADIKRRWNERQIAYNDAKMVLKLVDSVPDLKQYWDDHDDYIAQRVDRVRKMYESGGGFKTYGGLESAVREVMDEIKYMRDKLKYLADPFKAMQDHGLENARAANAAVEHKLNFFDSKGDLDWKIKKLKFEIDWLDKPENQKYSTWKVAQDAYKKALEEAELQKFWYNFQSATGDSVVQYMNTAKAKYPDLYGRMRVAYKSKDNSAMIDLISEFKEEEKWENNRTLYEHIKNNYPIAYKLEQNNDQFTFMTDMEYALAKRLVLKFKKAYDAAVQAIGTYNGYKVTAEDQYDELVQRGLGSSDAAKKLDAAVTKANIDELVEAIKEAKWVLEWEDRKKELSKYLSNNAVVMLNDGNSLGYLEAMEKAIRDEEEYPYEQAKKSLDVAIAKYNDYEKKATTLMAQLLTHNLVDDAKELRETLETYIFTDIEKALQKASDIVFWADIKKRADAVLTPENRDILKKLGHENFIDDLEEALANKNAGFVAYPLTAAEQALKDWRDLVDKAVSFQGQVPPSIEDLLGDAIVAVSINDIRNAIQRAEDYLAIYGPMQKELADLEAKKPDLKKALADKKAELKKQRADIAARRKKVNDEENRIKAMFPNLTEEWLKKNSSEFVAAEAERKKINADAKDLRANEAALADCVDKFDKWDDAVDNARLSIEQEDKKQARLFLDILSGIASDIQNLSGNFSGDWDASTYTQARKDAAFWAKVDPSKGIHDSQDAMREADKMLRQVAGAAWNAATSEQKDAIYAYTSSYHNIQEPLRGITYYGSSSSSSSGLARIPRITEIIETSSYNFDMWVQRFDDKMSLMKFGINPYKPITDDMMNALVGKTGTEGAFWSAGCAKGGGYKAGRNITFNIYCPRGTKMMYIEPISACGNGSGRSWDGKSSQRTFGGEIEALIQRGTTFRVIKVEKRGSGSFDSCSWFIDVEIVAQKPLPFPYAGGVYPYTKFDP